MRYRELKGYKYELVWAEEFKVNIPHPIYREYLDIDAGYLTAQSHYAWDGLSGPSVDTKTSMRGSLAHDALYQLMRDGLLDKKYREYADELLRKICLEDGMNKFRAWYIYKMVRMFGGKYILPQKNPRGKIVEC